MNNFKNKRMVLYLLFGASLLSPLVQKKNTSSVETNKEFKNQHS